MYRNIKILDLSSQYKIVPTYRFPLFFSINKAFTYYYQNSVWHLEELRNVEF